MEFVEVRRADVGNGAELHPTLAPVDPIVATLRTRLCGRIRVRCWPYKYIYDVLASAVHERRDLTTLDYIQAGALQRKAVAREIAYRWGEIELPVEPWLH